eukprot:Gb_06195 [translate_table: standard]
MERRVNGGKGEDGEMEQDGMGWHKRKLECDPWPYLRRRGQQGVNDDMGLRVSGGTRGDNRERGRQQGTGRLAWKHHICTISVLHISISLKEHPLIWSTPIVECLVKEIAKSAKDVVTEIVLGFILVIPPFNYPMNLDVSKIAPALVSGYSTMLKPPTQGAVAALHMDADLDLVVVNIIKEGFSFGGQRCTAVKVVLVMEDVVETVVNKANVKLAKLTLGPPEENCDITPVVSESSVNFVGSLVMDAKQKWAQFCQEYQREKTYGEVERRFVSQLLTSTDGLKSRADVNGWELDVECSLRQSRRNVRV